MQKQQSAESCCKINVPPRQLWGMIMKINIKTKRTVSYHSLPSKSNSNSVLPKKEADCVVYLKVSQIDFTNAKQLLDLMAGEKKTWGFFVLFAVILLWYFFIIQRATAFIIQMFSTIISALALSPLAWITLLRHLWVLHGVAENQPRPDLTGYWNGAEWTLVRGDTQNGITPNQFHLM